MRDRDLYAKILGIARPWAVTDVELDAKAEEVRVRVVAQADAPLVCPECGRRCGRYDWRERRWRHLDTCQFRTILVAEVPRVECAEHGVRQVQVPWAEPQSNFTALFEALVIDWLKEASLSAVARRLRMSWDEVDGIQARAVARGLARRQRTAVTQIGVDETAFQRRYEYVTVVVDRERARVVYVGDDRKKASLDAYFDSLTAQEREQIQSIAMDMWRPYIASVREKVPAGEAKIAFDKFHVAKHLGDAVDDVRKAEHRALRSQGESALTGTKYLWLENSEGMAAHRKKALSALRGCAVKTARAWALKEAAMDLWAYVRPAWARRAWKDWLGWAQRSRLEPMRRVARMIRDHLAGVVTSVVTGATNALAESMNSKIQWIKRTACGFRNRERFRNAIYFHLGRLDLYPSTLTLTHTGS